MTTTVETSPEQQAQYGVWPLDEHNQALLRSAHPDDWTNPTPQGRYNLVVLGAGTAGLVAAAGAAGLGAKVALVERRLMGGDCLNYGCVPSKALIRVARAVADIRRARELGVRLDGDPDVDFPAVMARMRALRARIAPHDSVQRFAELGIDVFLGDGRFAGPDTLTVEGQTLRFARACIATGARPVTPPIPGLADTGFLTNETVFSLTELPQRLAILGAGPIGCELAQTFVRFGAEVHLIDIADQVLGREDRDAAEIVHAALRQDGVSLLLGHGVARVERTADGKRLHFRDEDATTSLDVDELLVGVGRAPNVDGIGLEAAGVQFDKRVGVTVDDRLRTSNARIFAAGDVCSAYKFTHTADALARIVIQNALFFGRARASTLTVPWCTYTDPEVAHVGAYEHETREKGIATTIVRIEMNSVDRAILDGEEDGFVKILAGKRSGKILGATLVARHAGEMISEITALMARGGRLKDLSRTIHPYPTQAEVFKKAGDAHARTGLTPTVKKILSTILAWRR